MNETTALWLVITSTLLFTISMVIYNYKNLFKHDRSVLGVVFGLDNLRYTLMFMSFISTLYLLVKAGGIFLSEYNLTTMQTTLSFFGVITLSIFVSIIISSMLVSAERTFGEGGLTAKKKVAVAMIYIIVAVIDFSSISLGYSMVSNSLEAKKITKLDAKQDKTASFIIDNKRDIGLDLKEQLKSVRAKIKNISSTELLETKRVRSLRATLARCTRKNKPCPDTHAELERITKIQRQIKLDALNKERSTLQAKLLEITNSFERTSNTIKQAKNEAVQSIKEESEANKSTANTVAFMMGAFAFVISFLRSVLNDEETEVEGLSEHQESTVNIVDDKRHYILEAMKQRAKDLQYTISDSPGMGTESLTFPINDTRTKAIYLANKKSKLLTLSKENATNLIVDLKKKGGELEQWLSNTSWNMFKETDSSYYDDLEAS